MNAQVEIMQTKADKWGQQIQEGWVPQYPACKALETMIWLSLCYPLPAYNPAERQGKQITCILCWQTLPSLGACRNFPWGHAPTSLHGLALPYPYVEQGIAHIGLILTHDAIDTPTGSLLWVSLLGTGPIGSWHWHVVLVGAR
jgi:hypothetical protein